MQLLTCAALASGPQVHQSWGNSRKIVRISVLTGCFLWPLVSLMREVFGVKAAKPKARGRTPQIC